LPPEEPGVLRGKTGRNCQQKGNDYRLMRTMHGILGVIVMVAGLGLVPAGARRWAGPEAAPPSVRPGLEVLLSDSLHLVRGKRVGLVTHQAGVDHLGRRGVDVLRAAGIQVVALFSPEHGFGGTADPGALVASSIDSATGLPIYSLYGQTFSPTAEMLRGVDVLLIDLQDVGARYFTWLYTTVEVMRSAAPLGIPVVVLDRPNPIGGLVQGNVLDTTIARTAVGLLEIPMRHGMTLGELALLARHDLGLTTDLRVVPVAGWRRAMYFDETGLPFVSPSPNLRSIEALIHYPGLCLFEGTNLSVGRGSARPFEQLGVPGQAPTTVWRALQAAGIPGVRFALDSFTPIRPGDGKYADTLVTALRLTVTDRDRYDPTTTAVAILQQFGNLPIRFCPDCAPPDSLAMAEQFVLTFLPAHFKRLAGDRRSATWAEPGVDLATDWAAQRARFLERRRPFLIYGD